MLLRSLQAPSAKSWVRSIIYCTQVWSQQAADK
jgi:hypothetical protein